jgi:hypothetical protein
VESDGKEANGMPERQERTDVRDDEYVRCFRCGQLHPREHIVVLEDECPLEFRGHPLCSVCVETVKGKKRPGWWAQAATARR